MAWLIAETGLVEELTRRLAFLQFGDPSTYGESALIAQMMPRTRAGFPMTRS